MTPEDLQRVLRTEADYQRNMEAIRNGRGFPVVTAIVAIGIGIYLLLYGIP